MGDNSVLEREIEEVKRMREGMGIRWLKRESLWNGEMKWVDLG